VVDGRRQHLACRKRNNRQIHCQWGCGCRGSSKELPNNWLYRRDYVDGSGLFGIAGVDTGNNITSISDPSASATWWVDFSNFFEGVGALGGGDVTLAAGLDIINVDAVIPTNAEGPGACWCCQARSEC